MADTVPLSRAKLAQNLSIQPKRLTHTEYRTLNRINRLTDEDALNWLLVEYGSRKKLPLAAILKRFSKLTRNREDRARAADLADKLTRCGRIAARGTPRYRCGLNFCPLCQSNKENPTQARAQALVEAVLGKSPDRERLSYVTINADRILSGWEHTAARDFDNQIRQTMARFGHRAHGQYGYGLTGNLHAHMVVIHECSKGQLEADLKAVFRDKRQVLVEKLYETQSVGDAVKGIAVYDCAAVKNKDAKNECKRCS